MRHNDQYRDEPQAMTHDDYDHLRESADAAKRERVSILDQLPPSTAAAMHRAVDACAQRCPVCDAGRGKFCGIGGFVHPERLA